MDVDESFAGFVSARWSMLYRLATLLGGATDADELTQATLVRAYQSWREIHPTAQEDARVKRVLAETAARRANGRTGAVDTLPKFLPDRPQRWESLDRLLPRQRAVLVMRHYEGLSDTEIAEALGCSTSTVTADGLALETGVDLVALHEELDRRAREAEVPLPPVVSLLTQGHRARRERVRRTVSWTAAVAGVVLIALVVATALDGGTSRGAHPGRAASPVPVVFLSSLPAGPAPKVPFTEGRSLHLPDGRAVRLEGAPSAIAQAVQGVFVAYLSGAIVRIDARTGRSATVARSSGGELVPGPDGRRIAWLGAEAGLSTVVVTGPEGTGTAIAERTFPVTARCCDNPFVVNGITRDGAVVASLPAAHQVWVWDGSTGPDSKLVQIGGTGYGVVSQVTPDGIVLHRPPVTYAFGLLEDGTFRPTVALAAQSADFSDPLGRRIVYADATGDIWVRSRSLRGRSRRPGQVGVLGLPAISGGFASAHWEDPDHVLLDVSDASMPNGALVRCDVRTGGCELAATLDFPHLVANALPK